MLGFLLYELFILLDQIIRLIFSEQNPDIPSITHISDKNSEQNIANIITNDNNIKDINILNNSIDYN